MSYTVAVALCLVSAFYLYLGFKQKNSRLGDFLPTSKEIASPITHPNEFSASTTATSISLVTVVIAFFELASWFGCWLFWSVITTALGMLIVRLNSEKIWTKLNTYTDHKPTLHEFLSIEFKSRSIQKITAVMTSIGFLGAFSVELTVGSKFLSSMMPELPQFLMAVLLASVVLVYTLLGGFRTVIQTERYQMLSIWLMIAALGAFLIGYFIFFNRQNLHMDDIAMLFQLSSREGLSAFLIGLFLINVPTYLSDMSIWQKIAGTKDKEVLRTGSNQSIVSICFSWSGLIILALITSTIVSSLPGEGNPLFKLLNYIASYGFMGSILVFVASVGLFGAMLSTASTQLIASTHAIHLDVFHNKTKGAINGNQGMLLFKSRIILFLIGVLSIVIIELLINANFSIADLVFAIYGAQLSIFPVVLLALFNNQESNKHIHSAIPWAVGLGFVAGWISAIYGKLIEDANLVFLSPVASLLISLIVITSFWLYKKLSNDH